MEKWSETAGVLDGRWYDGGNRYIGGCENTGAGTAAPCILSDPTHGTGCIGGSRERLLT